MSNKVADLPYLEPKKWLNCEEAARYLGKTRNSIWLLVSKGILMKRKWRRRLYFKKAELDQIIENTLF